MTLTNEDIQAISILLQPIKDDMQTMKAEIKSLKDDVKILKDDVQAMKVEIQSINDEIQIINDKIEALTKRTAAIELSLENETNHNIQLLAENHINIVDKLNQTVKVQDKSLLFEVQVSGLKSRIENLEKEIATLKTQIA